MFESLRIYDEFFYSVFTPDQVTEGWVLLRFQRESGIKFVNSIKYVIKLIRKVEEIWGVLWI